MPSSSRVATTSAGAVSQNRSECNTARTLWRSASDSAWRAGRETASQLTPAAAGAGTVAREIPSARQAWAAPRSGATASTAVTSSRSARRRWPGRAGSPAARDFSWISMIFSACASRLARRSRRPAAAARPRPVGSALGRACAPGPGALRPRVGGANRPGEEQPLAAQQRADLARLGAGVGLTQDRELYSALAPPPGLLGTSGSGGLGMASGSTLVRAVIVTVMNWEYSLSPSSLNTEAEVSQLMLAGRPRTPTR